MSQLIITLFASLLFAGNAFAEKVIFASPENISPKIIKEGNVIRGTYVDIIREACKRLKVEPVFEQYPWARAISMVKTGKVNAIFPPFKTDERLEYLYFPATPMTMTRNVLFARKSRHIKIKKLEDLKSYVVGINDLYSYGPEFDNYKINLNLDVSRNEEMQINKLAHKGKIRMDIAAASEEAFKYINKRLGHDDEFEIIYLISETPSYVAFSIAAGEKNIKFAKEFNKVLIQLKQEGFFTVINDKYLK